MFSKTIFTIISLGIGIGVYIPYYISVFKKTTKPHLFSWLTWGTLTGLGFILSFRGGGGGGSWFFALQSIASLGIAGYALITREINIVFIDWVFFISAILIIFVYIFTKNAIISVFLATTIDFLGYAPTFRKSYSKPWSELALMYFLAVFGWLFSIAALQSYSFVTIFYPLMIMVANLALVLFLLIRRKSVKLA